MICPNCNSEMKILSESRQDTFIIHGRYWCSKCDALIKLGVLN